MSFAEAAARDVRCGLYVRRICARVYMCVRVCDQYVWMNVYTCICVCKRVGLSVHVGFVNMTMTWGTWRAHSRQHTHIFVCGPLHISICHFSPLVWRLHTSFAVSFSRSLACESSSSHAHAFCAPSLSLSISLALSHVRVISLLLFPPLPLSLLPSLPPFSPPSPLLPLPLLPSLSVSPAPFFPSSPALP